MNYRYRIHLFGPIQIEKDSQPLQTIRSRKGLALLAYLCRQSGPVSRSHLAEMFWPDKMETVGRRNLNRELSELSGQLPGCFQSDYHTVRFRPGTDCWLDILAFEVRVKQSRGAGGQGSKGELASAVLMSDTATGDIETYLESLAEAVRLYRGEFLAGHYLDDCPEFETWLLREQESWRQQATRLLERLAAAYMERRRDEQAEIYLRRWLALAPWSEEAHRFMMLLLARNGQRSAALNQYELCRRALAQELEVEPNPATVSLYEQIKKGEIKKERRKKIHEDDLLGEPAARPGHLPELLAPFIGRTEELVRLEGYLQMPECRLVTITGLGGTGKTWLALQAARTAMPAFGDGAYFVPLAGLAGADPAGRAGLEEVRQRLVIAITEALGLELTGRTAPFKQLSDYLRSKQLLLILDNFEYLLAEASLVSDLLQVGPGLKALVTSRERLNLLGEWSLTLEGLDYPPAPEPEPDWGRPNLLPPPEEKWRTPAGLEKLGRFNAVRLLSQRVGQIKPDFKLNPKNGPDIARLCQLAEGMPLAIELIAAQLGVFSPAELTRAIESNLGRLSATWTNLPTRQRNMRAVFEHSWSRLSQVDQTVLAHLSIFAGGFDLVGAEAVAGAGWEQLLRLVNKSLVRPVEVHRYELHELLRQFAAEKLAGQEGVSGQDRHSHYYLGCLQRQEKTLFGAEPHQAAAYLRPDLENIRQAWAWATATGRSDRLAPALAGLARFYEVSGFIREAASTFGRTAEMLQAQWAGADGEDLPQVGQADLDLLSRLLAQQARLGNIIGDLEQAFLLVQRAIELAQQGRSVGSEAYGYMVWGYILINRGKFQEAGQMLRQALKLARSIGDERLEAGCLWRLTHPVETNPTNLAQARQIAQRLGDYWLEYHILIHMGGAASYQGLLDHARRYWQQALEYALIINNPHRAANLRNNLGDIYRQLGAYERAAGYLEEALLTFRRWGDRLWESGALEGLSRLYFAMGQDQTAWESVQAGITLGQDLGDVNTLALLYNSQGHILAGQAEYGPAQNAYGQALRFSQQQHPAVAVESRAGLARLKLAQNDWAGAQAQVEAILAFLEQGGKLDGYTGPPDIYLACYQTLKVVQDGRAQAILAAAYTWLQEQAGAIEDESLRRSFLENIPAHREVARLWRQSQAVELEVSSLVVDKPQEHLSFISRSAIQRGFKSMNSGPH